MAAIEAPTRDVVTLTVDGRVVRARAGSTVLEAARTAGIRIPTLCYHPDLSVRANCRICVVEVRGSRVLQTACSCPASDGMVVATNTPAVRAARRTNLELLLSSHAARCAGCVHNLRCELQRLCHEYSVDGAHFAVGLAPAPVDSSARWIVRDPNRCILCRRCVAVCHEVQSVGAVAPVGRGLSAAIAPAFGRGLGSSPCVFCGQCIDHCPVGAVYERDQRVEVWRTMEMADAVVVAQADPLLWTALGAEPDEGTAALRRLGFRRVFGASTAVDLAALEGAHELVERLSGGNLPVLTAWCPAWVRFAEQFYPQLLPSLSTCKSPSQMHGALVKTYLAAREGVDPRRLTVVSATTCVARKLECSRPEMAASGYRDVDYALTARELARMLREAGVAPAALEPEPDDALPGCPGAPEPGPGGVASAIAEGLLCAAHFVAAQRNLDRLDFTQVPGRPGLREAALDLGGLPLRVAVVRGLGNARHLCDQIVAGEANYHFVEVMACPGGCAPTQGAAEEAGWASLVAELPAGTSGAGAEDADASAPLRRPHENPAALRLYAEFLGVPLGERAQQLLHTRYTRRIV